MPTYSSLPLTECYSQVESIVLHFEILYTKQFWLISDWSEEGQSVLLDLLTNAPMLMADPVRLRLCFRVQFVKHLETILSYQD